MKKHRDVWDRDIEQILLSEGELDEIVTRMAAQIDADYRDKNLLLLCILKGSLVFMGDLMKKLTIPCEIDCMKVSSYGNGSVSSGRILSFSIRAGPFRPYIFGIEGPVISASMIPTR